MSEGKGDSSNSISTNKNISRRRFLSWAGLIAGGAAATYLPSWPSVEAQGGTVPPPQEPEITPAPQTVDNWIQSINNLYRRETFSPTFAKGFTFESSFETVEELQDVFNTWGGVERTPNPLNSAELIDTPVLGQAMVALGQPILHLYCNPAEVPPFLAYEELSTQYHFVPNESGYKAQETQIVTEASIAGEDQFAEKDKKSEVQIEVYPLVNTASAQKPQFPDTTENFDVVLKQIVAEYGNGLGVFSRELLPFIQEYDKELVDISTTDGQFAYNTDATLFSPQELSDVHNLPKMGGYSDHALLLQSALKVLLPNGYNGVQTSIARFKDAFEQRSQQAIIHEDIKPCVYVTPYPIQDIGRLKTVADYFAGKDINNIKSIVALSTYNRPMNAQALGPIPKGIVCFTTVRKNADGTLFMPDNRSYIPNEDRMFGFPDEVRGLQLQLGAELKNNEMSLKMEYTPVDTVGASLSTLQGGAFFGAVISKLLKDGNTYSEDLVMTTINELCPQTQVGEATLRVPDIKKVEDFFKPKQATHLPYIGTGAKP